jgi:hypothetical protein
VTVTIDTPQWLVENWQATAWASYVVLSYLLYPLVIRGGFRVGLFNRQCEIDRTMTTALWVLAPASAPLFVVIVIAVYVIPKLEPLVCGRK